MCMVPMIPQVSMVMVKVEFSLVCTDNSGNRDNHVSVYMGTLIMSDNDQCQFQYVWLLW